MYILIFLSVKMKHISKVYNHRHALKEL